MKKFKKIVAGVLATATMAVTGVTAFADSSMCQSWSLDYTYGAPSSVSSQRVTKTLGYYALGYQSTCTDFYGGGDGYVSVQVDNEELWMITGTGKVPFGGATVNNTGTNTVDFTLVAVGNRVVAKGTIHLKGYNS